MSIFGLCNVIHCKSKSKHDGVKNSETLYKGNCILENSQKSSNIVDKMEFDEAKRNNLKAAKLAFQKLIAEWSKRPPNLDVCGQLLTELKVRNSL